MTELVLPRYGAGSLADLLPSVAARLGAPGFTDVLELPQAERYLVVLFDGLGLHLLNDFARALLFDEYGERALTAGVPSTTSVSLASVGTGLVPAQHGIAGYTFRLAGQSVCPLSWDNGIEPLSVQPRPTMFEELADAGITSARCFDPRHRESALTQIALRGGDFVAIRENATRTKKLAAIVEAATTHQLTYAYDRSLDHAAHGHGLASFEWVTARSAMVAFIRDLRDLLPAECVLLVTGDHGGIDIPDDTRLVIEDHPELVAGVELVAGEARFRHLYTTDPEAVAARWRAVLGERAWVRTRAEAVAGGWFGEGEETVADRFGDVVVAARGSWAFLSTTKPQEHTLVGMHGSLTAQEMWIPLGILRGRR